jgi:YCII-related domain
MTKFLVLYRGEQSAMELMARATPEQQQAGMQAWMTWAEKAGPAIVDLGAPLAPVADGGDGGLGGFSIMQAESAKALDAVLDGHPHTAQGGTIEVYEFLPMPGM